jgi:hypothetical protein
MSFNSYEEPLIFLKKILDDAVPGEYIVEARWNAACASRVVSGCSTQP